MTASRDSFGSRSVLEAGGRSFEIVRLSAAAPAERLARLPYSIRVLLENLLRHEDGVSVTADDVRALAAWEPRGAGEREIAFRPARVLMQDFTGVPAVVDLAAMRDAIRRMGGDPLRINPLEPAELVVDHSVQVDEFGSPRALEENMEREYARNRERYAFLRWGQAAFANFTVVPPGMGICHQVNLELLARVVFEKAAAAGGLPRAYPDTLLGTDSHTTMINGLGVLGWGVGGIEAEAALLGQPVSMLVPQVVGFRLTGKLADGATATDLVLTVTQMLRRHGVVGKFVEFHGPGLAELPLADRATIANMAPEYGATCGFFPVDAETLRYLRLSGRDERQVALVEAYARAQGLFLAPEAPEPLYSDGLALDLGRVEPSVAGPRRPQDRVALRDARRSFLDALPTLQGPRRKAEPTGIPGQPRVGRWEGEGGNPAAPGSEERAAPAARVVRAGVEHELAHGAIVIAAITSCTNTSNPSVMLAAGLLARKAAARGLAARPWVKSSLAPGSRVVTAYLAKSGLLADLEKVGFHVVGYGCTTCIGNSGPLPQDVSRAIEEHQLVAVSVLSGNRNFEGRINSEVRANYLMSPPLVVAYALAGRMDVNLATEPLATDAAGRPVLLSELWPTAHEVARALEEAVDPEMFRATYARVLEGDARWRGLPAPAGGTFAWDEASTYIRHPPYFVDMPSEPGEPGDVRGARVLALLGDSVTTDHISPAGSIAQRSPAAAYLRAHGVEPREFNSYGSRRGNHEVMVRGTFANVRLRNLLAPGTEGGVTRHLPDGETMSVFDAAERYRAEGVPLLVIAGLEYGTGSSRDWAAKGPALLGVRAVLARSFERIHRSNLVGMGIAPLELRPGEDAASLGLTGEERFDLLGLPAALAAASSAGRTVRVRAEPASGPAREFEARLRVDTPQEVQYYRHGGILPYVLRQLVAR